MIRRGFLAALVSAALVGSTAAAMAQPSTKVPRVGLLMGSTPSTEAATLDAFRGALEKLGYIDGETIRIELRYAMGQPDRVVTLAHELVALAPAVIACVGRQGTSALQAATRTIPIVFISGQRSRRARLCRVACSARRQHDGIHPDVGRA
jgi:putative tryptophan/tyrosine transport system substrate-binding protein